MGTVRDRLGYVVLVGTLEIFWRLGGLLFRDLLGFVLANRRELGSIEDAAGHLGRGLDRLPGRVVVKREAVLGQLHLGIELVQTLIVAPIRLVLP